MLGVHLRCLCGVSDMIDGSPADRVPGKRKRPRYLCMFEKALVLAVTRKTALATQALESIGTRAERDAGRSGRRIMQGAIVVPFVYTRKLLRPNRKASACSDLKSVFSMGQLSILPSQVDMLDALTYPAIALQR
nr:hypothetical protein CFP56_34914 [Quercus suber]